MGYVCEDGGEAAASLLKRNKTRCISMILRLRRPVRAICRNRGNTPRQNGRKLGALHGCIIPMCPSFHQCMPFSDNLPVCVEGALPLSSTFCPYRARYLLKPESWGDPGCRSLCSLYPGLRYPCPYRAPRLQNH